MYTSVGRTSPGPGHLSVLLPPVVRGSTVPTALLPGERRHKCGQDRVPYIENEQAVPFHLLQRWLQTYADMWRSQLRS